MFYVRSARALPSASIVGPSLRAARTATAASVRPPASLLACLPSSHASRSTPQGTDGLSDANKILITCAWSGNAEFVSQYGLEWSSLAALGVPAACPPPSTETVVLTLTASGSVSDYTDSDKSSLQEKVANVAGVDKSLVTIDVTAASVLIIATIAVPGAMTASQVMNSLSSSLGTTADASTALGITVEEGTITSSDGTIGTLTITGDDQTASPDDQTASPESPEYVENHNAWRALHEGTDNLVYDAELAAAAQAFADTCPTGHNDPNQGDNGENLYFAASSSGPPDTPYSDAVNSWYGEIKDYAWPQTYGATKNINGGVVGHFTQVVWKGTTKVGCGKNTGCTNMFGPGLISSAVVCRCAPPPPPPHPPHPSCPTAQL